MIGIRQKELLGLVEKRKKEIKEFQTVKHVWSKFKIRRRKKKTRERL